MQVLLKQPNCLCRCPRGSKGQALHVQVASHANPVVKVLEHDSRGSCSRVSAQRAGKDPAFTAASRALLPTRMTDAYCWKSRDMASGDLDFFLQQVEAQAAPGSSWSPKDKAEFMAIADALGGKFFLVQSANWDEGLPHAGKPAYAAVNVVCCVMKREVIPLLPKQRVVKQKKMPPVLQREPVAGAPNQYFVPGVFKLDANGWPTGEIYNSLSSFTELTTRKANMKPDQTNIVWEHQARETLARWFKHHYVLQGVGRVPLDARTFLRKWYHSLVLEAGGSVDFKEDITVFAEMAGQHARERRERRQQPVHGEGH